ncbi:MAG: penicillin-binding protein [Candidatus Nomurabacteria bacterium]|jgi:penicillin-binding protein 1A|nr:penicillin-binding protein [Candidatus Nomurabacteria bacterium]
MKKTGSGKIVAAKVKPKTPAKSSQNKAKYGAYVNLTRAGGKANFWQKRRIKKDARLRKKAEYLATLPKNPVKRFFARLSPKHFFKYWFSRDGARMLGKIVGVIALCILVLGGAAFMYFRHEIAQLSPEELSKKVATTVTKYLDRNGNLLWEDEGSGDYRLVVDSDAISKYMKEATVAIEDKDFYKHGGISLSGTFRAVLNNVKGSGDVQGGSTLTQQLVKQVYFEDEAGNRGIGGIPRKIKEAILSIEAERVYSKDQILTMYLNESPYGGRRNGVESAAQTYFGKSAKDLTLPEAALLAAIPQSPTLYNPYNTSGNQALLDRQHTVLEDMADQGYISKSDAAAAEKVSVLDELQPESDQFTQAKAPYFVQMVKQDLENTLGEQVVGQGGLTVTTTLDIRVQNVIDDEMVKLFNGKVSGVSPTRYGFDNASMVMIDNQTGQILGLRGGRDYNYPGYGAVNEATTFLQPGSSIKPEVYASLIDTNRSGTTYGAGSIIQDSAIPQSIYTTADGKSVQNDDYKFHGNVSIRKALAGSLNIPAIKAMYFNGVDKTWATIRAMGDTSYCTDGVDQTAGLSSALGSCGAKQVEHANAFATLARGGEYTPVVDFLSVKNSSGQTIKTWEDIAKPAQKQVIDPQTAYILSDILSDQSARSYEFGYHARGAYIPGIKTATKTGTSNLGNYPHDLWMMSYTPKATFSVWAGNHDSTHLKSGGFGASLGQITADVTTQVYKNVFEPDGSYTANQWFSQPDGIQKLSINGSTDIYPSWYNKKSGTLATTKMTFDQVSKKLATDCTPAAAKVQIDVTKTTDPITKKTTLSAADGYDPNSSDDKHSCSDQTPFIGTIAQPIYNGNGTFSVSVIVKAGTFPLSKVTFTAGGQSYDVSTPDSTGAYTWVTNLTGSQSVSVVATDQGFYTSNTDTQTLNFNQSGD